ncbi:polyadenylate-specific 3'-exoribonuclease AS [Corynebacterium sp. sy039]|uniref:polyadenylate-specific 3'-exoribonuclease AS n=1 Tax=Corynebacterium sp. sy039 TaxID=2599641 RepID=UPI0011B69E98|nr:polyadenylate-specific 3'-exoribonuclease AS [Corynebacterium sp. sy039]QDZ42934.1 polyadenylate-specific 3'-exoribonuclease AS [Corynebacterium sp. sy039]
MRYFYDTEFIEDGHTIELVSIGVVAEDGREYYAVSTQANHAKANKWVRDNVLDKLPNPSDPAWRDLHTIRQDLIEFFRTGVATGGAAASSPVQLWAWVGAYDHVVLAQLWGDMSGLPSFIPRYTHELKQYWEMAGKPPLPHTPSGNHDALVDARHNREKFRCCAQKLPLSMNNTVLGI